MTRSKKTPFQPWQTCNNKGEEKRYIRLGNSLLLHKAVFDLSDKAFRVYVYMLIEAGGEKKFTYPRSKYKYISSIDGFQRAKKELIQKGFIKEIEKNKQRRKENLYEFSEDWKNYIPP